MHTDLAHAFVAEIRVDGDTGIPLRMPLPELDLAPLEQWARFSHARSGARLNVQLAQLQVEPHWDADAGAPAISGLWLTSHAEGRGHCDAIPLAYFAQLVAEVLSSLVDQGKVEEGARATWRVLAFPSRRTHAAADLPFAVEALDDDAGELPRRPLGDLLGRARYHGPTSPSDGSDFPVFIDRVVLADAVRAAAAAGEVEAGSLLLGRISRDTASTELLLEVTAQVPLADAANASTVNIGPASWGAAYRAIADRGQGEQILGFLHSHPLSTWPCAKCTPELRAACLSRGPRFSAMDVNVMRTAFPSPLHVAPLLSFQDGPSPSIDVFGWRRGVLVQRGFHVI